MGGGWPLTQSEIQVENLLTLILVSNSQHRTFVLSDSSRDRSSSSTPDCFDCLFGPPSHLKSVQVLFTAFNKAAFCSVSDLGESLS